MMNSPPAFLHIRVGPPLSVEGLPTHSLGYGDIFARWHWDGVQLTVHNDRYGMQPVYHFHGPGEFCIASSLVTLLERGAARELDHDALAVFFQLDYFLGEDTPFRAIRALPPGASLRWSREGLSIESKRPPITPFQLNRTTALAEYQQLFAAAIERMRPEGPFGVLLSGGRDSRHILFELCRQGCKPTLAATLDMAHNDDAAVARLMTAGLDIPHLVIEPAPPSRTLEERKNLLTNFCADEHAWLLAVADALRGQVPVLFDGIGGDVLSAGLFLEPVALAHFRARRFGDLARHLLAKESAAAFVPILLPAEPAKEMSTERAEARLIRELEKHADAPNPCGSYFFWNRTRREIALAPFAILSDQRVLAPYLDPDLFDFLMSLPAEMLLDHTLHDETIARAYPEWSHWPYSTKRKRHWSWASCRLAWKLAWWVAQTRSLNRTALLPRLLRAGVDPRYNVRAMQYLLPLPVYWAQLNRY